MKWSTAAALLAAPLALAGSIERDLGFLERRSSHEVKANTKEEVSKGSNGKGNQVLEVSGGSTTVVVQEIIIIWVNNGGGATTSQVNSATSAAGAAAAATHTVGSSFITCVVQTSNVATGNCRWCRRIGLYTKQPLRSGGRHGYFPIRIPEPHRNSISFRHSLRED